MEQKLVIVIGRGRCGTSMVTGLLSRLGVDFGSALKPFGKLRKRKHPEGGYGGAIFDEKLHKFIPQYAEKAKEGKSCRGFKEEIKKVAEKRREIWGWKNINSLYLAPYLKEFKPYYVVCYRNIEAQIKSFERIGALSMRFEILNYNQKVDGLLKNEKRLDVWFEELFENSTREIKRLCDFLGVKYKPVEGFIDPKLKHY